MDKRQRTSRRLYWLIAWVCLTAVGALIHAAAWVPPDDTSASVSAIAERGILKHLSNAADCIVGPIWMVLAIVNGDWGVYSPVQNVIANGIASLLVLLAVIVILRRRRRWIERPETGANDAPNLARRRLIFDAPAAVIGIAGAGGVASAAFIQPFDLRTTRYAIQLRGLPIALKGLRIAFVSDTHLGPRVPLAYLQRAVRECLAERPDLVLLGGDYVHSGSRYIDPGAAVFKPFLDAGLPVVGVLGNHDWYNSRGLVSLRLRELGVRMVDNGRVFLDASSRKIVAEPPQPGEAVCIAGIGDVMNDVVDIRAALSGVHEDMPRILLSHNPDAAEFPELIQPGAHRVDLMLCGHTHGGQIRIPGIGPLYVPCKLGYKYDAGIVQGPAFPVLISRGVGVSICPVRFGVPPEIVIITLA